MDEALALFNADQDVHNPRLQNTTMDSGYYSLDGDDDDRFSRNISSLLEQMNASGYPQFHPAAEDVLQEPDSFPHTGATRDSSLFDFPKYFTELPGQPHSDIDFDYVSGLGDIDPDFLLELVQEAPPTVQPEIESLIDDLDVSALANLIQHRDITQGHRISEGGGELATPSNRNLEPQTSDPKALEFAEVWLKHGGFPSKTDIMSLANFTPFTTEIMEMAFNQLRKTSISASGADFGQAVDSHLPSPLPPSLEEAVACSKDIFDQATLWMKQNSRKCLRRSNTVPSSSHGSGKYRCTLGCGQTFDLKEVWKRHEREQCPQKGWICDLPAIVRIRETPTCSRCGLKNPDVSHLAQPCLKTRAPGSCRDQPLSHDRIFYRKERLKAHLLREHPGISCEAYLNGSHFAIQPDYPPECTRPSCERYRFKNFDDRINHLAEHFEMDAKLGGEAEQDQSADPLSEDDAHGQEILANEIAHVDGFLDAPQQVYGMDDATERSVIGDSLHPSSSLRGSSKSRSAPTMYSTSTAVTTRSEILTCQRGNLGEASYPENVAHPHQLRSNSGHAALGNRRPQSVDSQSAIPIATVHVPTLGQRESDDSVLGTLESAMACFNRWTVEPVLKIAQGIKQTLFRIDDNANIENSRMSFEPEPGTGLSTMNMKALTPVQDSPISTLAEALRHARVESPAEQGIFFIPNNELERMITQENIKTELQRILVYENPRDCEKTASSIVHQARKIFATLVLLGRPAFIQPLLDEGLTDEHLPLSRIETTDNVHGSLRFNYSLRTCSGRPVKALRIWESHAIEEFLRVQWMFLAPVFDFGEEIKHYDLPDNCVLPFIEDEERTNAKSGGYSEVWGVRIHPAHQNLYRITSSSDKPPMLAVKRLFSSSEVDFKKEVEALKVISAHHHPHLIQLLATYRHKEKYHLLFPMAQGDLRSYWNLPENPPADKDSIPWMLKQLRGITDGLASIHNHDLALDLKKNFLASMNDWDRSNRRFGRHGDIKPENILFVDEDFDEDHGPSTNAQLLIADFGLTDFHTASSRSRVDPRSIGGSPTYEPPERSLNLPISRAYDVWSLGCVYLEFLTWLLSGPTGVRSFADARQSVNLRDGIDEAFFTPMTPDADGRPRATVKKTVSDHIAALRAHNGCSHALQDLLDLIEGQMLVVAPTTRVSSSKLVQHLDEILDRGERNQDYFVKNSNPQPIENQSWRKRTLSARLNKSEPPSKRVRVLSASIGIFKGGNLQETENILWRKRLPEDKATSISVHEPLPKRHRSMAPE